MTQKPFDPTKPVQTRNGRPARIVDANFKGFSKEYSLAVIVTETDGKDSFQLYKANGTANPNYPDWDLINIPEKHIRWFNFYKNNFCSLPYFSKEAADRECDDLINRIACVRVEFTEGEGLD